MDKTDISQQDRELFRATVGNITPLYDDRVMPASKQLAPVPVQTLRDQEQVLQETLSDAYDGAELETGEELWFCRPGLQWGLLRKLRRGQFSLQGELDLHGMTVPMARHALTEFLHDSRLRGAVCVRIVHGKGRGSPRRQPVLKSKVNLWLQQRDEVLAFCSARPVDGGTGAVYVLLKRP
jgi:DNA-nicking Smr family endonuclease